MIFFADILSDLGVVLQTVANNSSSLVRRSSRHVDSYRQEIYNVNYQLHHGYKFSAKLGKKQEK